MSAASMASSSSAAAAAAVSSEDKARAEAFKAEGNEKYKAGQYNAAIDAYGKAIAVDPANSAFYANRAAAAMMCGRFQDAVQDCDKAIELRPDFMKAYMRGATARLRMVRHRVGWSGAFVRPTWVARRRLALRRGRAPPPW